MLPKIVYLLDHRLWIYDGYILERVHYHVQVGGTIPERAQLNIDTLSMFFIYQIFEPQLFIKGCSKTHSVVETLQGADTGKEAQ